MNSKIFPVLLAGLIFAGGPVCLASEELSSRVIVEGAVVNPCGDLGADFSRAALGLGADPGYEAGFRLRLPLTPALSISPGFHFVDFQSDVVMDAADLEYQTEALSYRFTLEWMYKPTCARGFARPFVAVAGGLYRNRVVGYYGDPTAEKRDDSVNTFGTSGRAGVIVSSFEFSVVVHRNVVDTRRFFRTGGEEEYRWHQVGFRMGYLLPW